MQLPDLKHDFSDALIQGVTFGPRQEMTLRILTGRWIGQTGYYNVPIALRFGGIKNLDVLREFFASSPHLQSELAHLSYDKDHKSKPGHLFVDLTFERIDARTIIECSSIKIDDPKAQ